MHKTRKSPFPQLETEKNPFAQTSLHVRGFGCVQNEVISTYRKSAQSDQNCVEPTKKTSHWKSRAFSSKTPTKTDLSGPKVHL